MARSVRAFVESVASIDEPVPAGGSVAALTGASSAALLALVCGVLARKGVEGASELLARARAVQDRLLALVDEDSTAFRAYLHAKTQRVSIEGALKLTTQTPLEIATACAEVVSLSRDVQGRTQGPLLGDVLAARTLANAAVATALDISEQNVPLLHSDPAAQTRLRDQIASLRAV